MFQNYIVNGKYLMSSWKRVSNHKPCLICSGKSWCSWLYRNDGTVYIICMRQVIGSYKTTYAKDSSVAMYHHILHDGLNLKKFPSYKSPKKITNIASVDKRNVVFNDLLDGHLSVFHLNYLKQRGFNEKQLKELQYTSVVPINRRDKLISRLIENHGDLTGIPGFWKTNYNKWKYSATQGILLPVRSKDNKIIGCQIATDRSILRRSRKNLVSNEEILKYVWLTSAPMEDSDKTTGEKFIRRKNGVSAEVGLHFAGIQRNSFTKSPNEVIIGEGVMKADQINSRLNKLVISMPGIGICARQVSEFVIGIKDITLALDMDWKENKHVRNAMIGLIDMIESNRGLENVKVAVWPEQYKGLDDLILEEQYNKIDYVDAKEWRVQNGE